LKLDIRLVGSTTMRDQQRVVIVPARYVEAAVGRHISRRWALNSRFYRAMKMSRLINTSGSRSHSQPSLPRLPAPRLTLSLSLSLPCRLLPAGETKEEVSFVGCTDSACFFSLFSLLGNNEISPWRDDRLKKNSKEVKRFQLTILTKSPRKKFFFIV